METNIENNLLFVLGGALKGDTLHSLMHLKKLSKDFNITWIHGKYHRDVVKLLQKSNNLNIINTIELDEPHYVGNLNNIKLFNGTIPIQEYIGYDVYYNAIDTIFPSKDMHNNKNNCIDLEYDLPEENRAYIGLQLSSYHSISFNIIKEITAIRQISSNFPLITFGLPQDSLHPNSIDKRGIDLYDIVKELNKCKLFIGIHSFVSWIALYLGIPVIACHFMSNLINFSSLHNNCIDLINPNRLEIEKAIDEILFKKM